MRTGRLVHADAVVAPGARSASPAGCLVVPALAQGVAVLGSVGASADHLRIADHLADAGLVTVVLDLVSEDERREEVATDVELLAVRYLTATWKTRRVPACNGLPVVYLGTGIAGAAALWAASEDPTVAAVVSWDGRLELARARLEAVAAPTLLIVGAGDPPARGLNEEAARRLRCEHWLEVVPNSAGPGGEQAAVESVGRLAGHWFAQHLEPPAPTAPRD